MSELLDSIEVLSRARELTRLVIYLSLEGFCQNIIHQLYIPYFFVSNEFDLKVISIELLSGKNSLLFCQKLSSAAHDNLNNYYYYTHQFQLSLYEPDL